MRHHNGKATWWRLVGRSCRETGPSRRQSVERQYSGGNTASVCVPTTLQLLERQYRSSAFPVVVISLVEQADGAAILARFCNAAAHSVLGPGARLLLDKENGIFDSLIALMERGAGLAAETVLAANFGSTSWAVQAVGCILDEFVYHDNGADISCGCWGKPSALATKRSCGSALLLHFRPLHPHSDSACTLNASLYNTPRVQGFLTDALAGARAPTTAFSPASPAVHCDALTGCWNLDAINAIPAAVTVVVLVENGMTPHARVVFQNAASIGIFGNRMGPSTSLSQCTQAQYHQQQHHGYPFPPTECLTPAMNLGLPVGSSLGCSGGTSSWPTGAAPTHAHAPGVAARGILASLSAAVGHRLHRRLCRRARAGEDLESASAGVRGGGGGGAAAVVGMEQAGRHRGSEKGGDDGGADGSGEDGGGGSGEPGDGSGGEGPDGSTGDMPLLSSLFRLEPEKLGQMLAAVLGEDGAWQGIVHVPPNLRPESSPGLMAAGEEEEEQAVEGETEGRGSLATRAAMITAMTGSTLGMIGDDPLLRTCASPVPFFSETTGGGFGSGAAVACGRSDVPRPGSLAAVFGSRDQPCIHNDSYSPTVGPPASGRSAANTPDASLFLSAGRSPGLEPRTATAGGPDPRATAAAACPGATAAAAALRSDELRPSTGTPPAGSAVVYPGAQYTEVPGLGAVGTANSAAAADDRAGGGGGVNATSPTANTTQAVELSRAAPAIAACEFRAIRLQAGNGGTWGARGRTAGGGAEGLAGTACTTNPLASSRSMQTEAALESLSLSGAGGRTSSNAPGAATRFASQLRLLGVAVQPSPPFEAPDGVGAGVATRLPAAGVSPFTAIACAQAVSSVVVEKQPSGRSGGGGGSRGCPPWKPGGLLSALFSSRSLGRSSQAAAAPASSAAPSYDNTPNIASGPVAPAASPTTASAYCGGGVSRGVGRFSFAAAVAIEGVGASHGSVTSACTGFESAWRGLGRGSCRAGLHFQDRKGSLELACGTIGIVGGGAGRSPLSPSLSSPYRHQRRAASFHFCRGGSMDIARNSLRPHPHACVPCGAGGVAGAGASGAGPGFSRVSSLHSPGAGAFSVDPWMTSTWQVAFASVDHQPNQNAPPAGLPTSRMAAATGATTAAATASNTNVTSVPTPHRGDPTIDPNAPGEPGCPLAAVAAAAADDAALLGLGDVEALQCFPLLEGLEEEPNDTSNEVCNGHCPNGTADCRGNVPPRDGGGGGSGCDTKNVAEDKTGPRGGSDKELCRDYPGAAPSGHPSVAPPVPKWGIIRRSASAVDPNQLHLQQQQQQAGTETHGSAATLTGACTADAAAPTGSGAARTSSSSNQPFWAPLVARFRPGSSVGMTPAAAATAAAAAAAMSRAGHAAGSGPGPAANVSATGARDGKSSAGRAPTAGKAGGWAMLPFRSFSTHPIPTTGDDLGMLERSRSACVMDPWVMSQTATGPAGAAAAAAAAAGARGPGVIVPPPVPAPSAAPSATRAGSSTANGMLSSSVAAAARDIPVRLRPCTASHTATWLGGGGAGNPGGGAVSPSPPSTSTNQQLNISRMLAFAQSLRTAPGLPGAGPAPFMHSRGSSTGRVSAALVASYGAASAAAAALSPGAGAGVIPCAGLSRADMVTSAGGACGGCGSQYSSNTKLSRRGSSAASQSLASPSETPRLESFIAPSTAREELRRGSLVPGQEGVATSSSRGGGCGGGCGRPQTGGEDSGGVRDSLHEACVPGGQFSRVSSSWYHQVVGVSQTAESLPCSPPASGVAAGDCRGGAGAVAGGGGGGCSNGSDTAGASAPFRAASVKGMWYHPSNTAGPVQDRKETAAAMRRTDPKGRAAAEAVAAAAGLTAQGERTAQMWLTASAVGDFPPAGGLDTFDEMCSPGEARRLADGATEGGDTRLEPAGPAGLKAVKSVGAAVKSTEAGLWEGLATRRSITGAFGSAAQLPHAGAHEGSGDSGGGGDDRSDGGGAGAGGGSRVATSIGMAAAANTSECWHEVVASGLTDPGSGLRAVVLLQRDVSAKVVAERHVAQVSETEHRLLEQIFPRHVLQYVMEEAVGFADGSAGQVENPQTTWRPRIRDCNRLATWHPRVTVLFADIQGFTPMCKVLPPHVVMSFLNQLFTKFDAMLDEHHVYKVETIGDCYMVAGGLIHEDEDGMAAVQGGGQVDPDQAANVVAFAKSMLRAASCVRLPTSGQPVKVRVGIHSGPVVSGVVGTRMPRFCLFGDTVNTASRMESSGVPGAIHASEDCFEMLRAAHPDAAEGWETTGGVEVKGKGLMRTYVWNPPLSPASPPPTPSSPPVRPSLSYSTTQQTHGSPTLDVALKQSAEPAQSDIPQVTPPTVESDLERQQQPTPQPPWAQQLSSLPRQPPVAVAMNVKEAIMSRGSNAAAILTADTSASGSSGGVASLVIMVPSASRAHGSAECSLVQRGSQDSLDYGSFVCGSLERATPLLLTGSNLGGPPPPPPPPSRPLVPAAAATALEDGQAQRNPVCVPSVFPSPRPFSAAVTSVAGGRARGSAGDGGSVGGGAADVTRLSAGWLATAYTSATASNASDLQTLECLTATAAGKVFNDSHSDHLLLLRPRPPPAAPQPLSASRRMAAAGTPEVAAAAASGALVRAVAVSAAAAAAASRESGSRGAPGSTEVRLNGVGSSHQSCGAPSSGFQQASSGGGPVGRSNGNANRARFARAAAVAAAANIAGSAATGGGGAGGTDVLMSSAGVGTEALYSQGDAGDSCGTWQQGAMGSSRGTPITRTTSYAALNSRARSINSPQPSATFRALKALSKMLPGATAHLHGSPPEGQVDGC